MLQSALFTVKTIQDLSKAVLRSAGITACLGICVSAFGQESALPFADKPGGSGKWPAIVEVRRDLPSHTVYRPASFPDDSVPVLVWGNGGCSDNGLAHEAFLREIASHGYFVISLGYVRDVGTAVVMPPDSDATSVAQMAEALGWVSSVNSTQGDPLAGHLDLENIAVAGHSCGGLQAISFSSDPRVDTTLIFNSGVYNQPGGRSKIQVEKSALDALHAPIAYFTGGPSDLAHPNASDDASRIHHVPVFFGWLPVGHGGTFSAPDGGEWAEVAVHWLDWQLKGDADAAGWYRGRQCSLCRDERWTVESFIQP